MSSAPSATRFLDACRGRAVDRPPVWMMRQAGRYLPEYRQVREKVSFMELCRTPELAAEVSLQPFRRFRPDGVIFFSDILVPIAAMGARVDFGDGGPELPEPVRSAGDVARLRRFDPSREIPFTGKILSTLAREVGDKAAVLGFAGAPWTLASYLIEGGGSKSYTGIKQMMGNEPATLHRLLDLLSDVVADVLSYQIESGAKAVQLFDTWAGELSARDYREWALPAVTRAIARLRRDDVPVILFVNGCAHLLEAMAESGADVLSVDWRVSLSEARRRSGRLALQGNLDPGVLLGPPEKVTARTREMIAETGGRGHIVNLGHGVLPPTPIESVEAFFATVREAFPARGSASGT
ncbi:MAG TPA: uroporphyrinogen decarboxylase, partial [Thermoanaerobaculia bacterium]|nr:uroporphyrinogen decarboxylase [Thermoanaerobaculia bacterium]